MRVDRDVFDSTKYVSVFEELILATMYLGAVLSTFYDCSTRQVVMATQRHTLQVYQDQNSSGIFTTITTYQCGD